MCSCSGLGERPQEAVLSPGTEVIFTNRCGTMRIAYVSPLKRRYSWSGGSKVVGLVARKERWDNALGLYSAGGLFSSFGPRAGVSRIVAGEAVRDFASVEEFLKWHGGRWNKEVENIVYNNSGLAAGWCVSPSRGQLNVDLWQILIAGRKPHHLPRAQNSAVIRMARLEQH